MAQWCRSNRHRTVKEQWQTLTRKLRGHFEYYGITGNFEALGRFREEVRRRRRKWLGRRSQRGRLSWERFVRLEQHYPLPSPGIRRLWHPA